MRLLFTIGSLHLRWRWLLALGLSCASSLPAHAQSITRGPYLQRGTSTTMTLIWRTKQATNALVQIGPAPGQWTRTVRKGQSAIQHEIVLKGLTPYTRYYYAVGTHKKVLAGNDSAHFFRTAPTPGSVKKFRFWVVGDSGTGGPDQRAVRDSMLKFMGSQIPELFLHMGDMAYHSGTDQEFQRNFFHVYQPILRNTVVWPTLGNHEGHSSRSGPQAGPYFEAFALPRGGEAGGLASGTEAYYSFDYANVHFVVLDSHDSDRTPHGPMLSWLKNDLAATKQTWIVAYWHHPPYSKGSHDSDLERQLIDMRRYALPILEAGGVDLVLSGHSHVYERSYLVHKAYATPTLAKGKILDRGDGRVTGSGPYVLSKSGVSKGTVYVVAGHGGAMTSLRGKHPLMLVSEAKHGSCMVEVKGNVLSLNNIRKDGTISDSFALVKGQALLLGAPNGGEKLLVGSQTTIRWQLVGVALPHVVISLSRDGGVTWRVIALNAPNTGSFAWTVPATVTNKAMIKIEGPRGRLVDQSERPFSITNHTTRQAIAFGEVWKYHDRGIDLGARWLQRTFDTSTWAKGAGQLGYGDGDEKSLLKRPTPRHPSVYFRKQITLTKEVTKATLKVLHDDGVIVWVNGREVFSKYATNGTQYSALASQQSTDNEISQATIPLTAGSPFVRGVNVIGVMIKQSSSTSSDLSFDLALALTLPASSPPKPRPEPRPEPRLEPQAEPSESGQELSPSRESGFEHRKEAAQEPRIEPLRSTEPVLDEPSHDAAGPTRESGQDADALWERPKEGSSRREVRAAPGEGKVEITFRGCLGCQSGGEGLLCLWLLGLFWLRFGRGQVS